MIKKKVTLEDFKLACKNGMRALHWDVETSPMEVYTFSIGYNLNVSHKQIKKGSEVKVISIQYKWEGDKKTQYLVWDYGRNGGDDTKMLKKFVSEVLSKADMTIGQNTDGFDFKVLNDRLCLLGLPPADDTLSLDILKMSRKSFRMPSNKLDYRSHRHGQGGKHNMDMQDWIDIVEGRVPAEKKMIPYGCKDVDDEQQVMYREFDYYKNIPKKIQKLILEHAYPQIEKELRKFCKGCAKRKKPKFNLQNAPGIGHFCNNCGNDDLGEC